MKKTITIMISFLAIMSFTTSAWAATWTQGSAGAALTIGAQGAGNDDFSFAPSPGVLVDGDNTDVAYTILTGNAKAAADAIAYSVCSGLGGVAQVQVDLTTSTTLGAVGTVGQYATGFETK